MRGAIKKRQFSAVGPKPIYGDGVPAVGVPGPADRGRLAAAGLHPDLVRDQETGQQSDAELPEELVPGEAQVVPLGAAPDRGQQLVYLRLGQPDAVVADPQGTVAGQLGRFDEDATGPGRVGGTARRDRVGGVLQQLADVHPGAGVQVVAQQVDHAPQVDLEGPVNFRSHRPQTVPARRNPAPSGFRLYREL